MVLRSEALVLVGDLDRSGLDAADATGVAVISLLSKGKTCDSKYVWKKVSSMGLPASASHQRANLQNLQHHCLPKNSARNEEQEVGKDRGRELDVVVAISRAWRQSPACG